MNSETSGTPNNEPAQNVAAVSEDTTNPTPAESNDAPASMSRAARHYYTSVPETSHDDFDWSVDKRNVASYKEDDRQKFDSLYGNTFKSIAESELLRGSIVGLTKTDAIINIGFKAHNGVIVT